MKKLTIVAIFSLLVPQLLFAEPAVISSSYLLYRPTVNDMRARAMGNTEVLANEAINGCLSNPSSIASLDKFGISFGMNSISGDNEISGLNIGETSNYHIYHEGAMSGTNSLSHMSIAMTRKDVDSPVSVGFGLAYQQLYSAVNMERNELMIYDYSTQNSVMISTFNQNERFSFISPVIAFKIKSVSVGISSSSGLRRNNSADHYNYDYQFEHTDLTSDSTLIENYSEDESWERPGDFVTLGFRYEFRNFVIGGMFRSMWSIHKYDVSYPCYSPWGYREAIKNYDSIPRTIGIGISYSPLDNLVLVGEYQTRSYSVNSGYQTSYDDGDVRRFGIEFAPAEDVYFRAGYYRESLALFSVNSNSPETMTGYTAGIGITKGIFVINLAMEYGTFSHDIIDMGFPDGTEIYLQNDRSILNVGMNILIVI